MSVLAQWEITVANVINCNTVLCNFSKRNKKINNIRRPKTRDRASAKNLETRAEGRISAVFWGTFRAHERCPKILQKSSPPVSFPDFSQRQTFRQRHRARVRRPDRFDTQTKYPKSFAMYGMLGGKHKWKTDGGSEASFRSLPLLLPWVWGGRPWKQIHDGLVLVNIGHSNFCGYFLNSMWLQKVSARIRVTMLRANRHSSNRTNNFNANIDHSNFCGYFLNSMWLQKVSAKIRVMMLRANRQSSKRTNNFNACKECLRQKQAGSLSQNAYKHSHTHSWTKWWIIYVFFF